MAYVVTAERAATRYQELGVDKPWHVIPQGVSLSSVTEELVAQAAGRRGHDEVVVGWMAAHLLTAEDRDGDDSLYNVDHLLELWNEIHARLPHARLWLVGGASDRVRKLVSGRDDIVLFGRLPREQALATAANFDLALYPRTKDQGIQAAKVGEFIGLGVPTVSYDYKVTENLRETGAGVLVPTPREFVDAVVRLGEDGAAREEVAAAARRAGRELDWDVLARRYEEEILDRWLPPRGDPDAACATAGAPRARAWRRPTGTKCYARSGPRRASSTWAAAPRRHSPKAATGSSGSSAWTPSRRRSRLPGRGARTTS